MLHSKRGVAGNISSSSAKPVLVRTYGLGLNESAQSRHVSFCDWGKCHVTGYVYSPCRIVRMNVKVVRTGSKDIARCHVLV